jgi:hypothetical protein
MISFLVPSIRIETMAFELSDRAEYRQFEMVKGDTLPSVNIKFLQDVNTPLNLSNYSVKCFIRNPELGDHLNTNTDVVITNAQSGEARYDWVSGDTILEGIHYAEFKLIDINQRQLTMPDRIRINFI